MSLTKNRMEQALRYLAETDETDAYHKAHVARAEHKAKKIKEAMFLHSDKKTVADRQADAADSEEYDAAMANYFEAVREFQHVRNKRTTETIVIDVWRSLNAARNKGQIV